MSVLLTVNIVSHNPARSSSDNIPSSIVSGFGCDWLSLQVSAVTLPISKSTFLSHHQQTGSFQSQQQTTGKDNARNADEWGVDLVETA